VMSIVVSHWLMKSNAPSQLSADRHDEAALPTGEESCAAGDWAWAMAGASSAATIAANRMRLTVGTMAGVVEGLLHALLDETAAQPRRGVSVAQDDVA